MVSKHAPQLLHTSSANMFWDLDPRWKNNHSAAGSRYDEVKCCQDGGHQHPENDTAVSGEGIIRSISKQQYSTLPVSRLWHNSQRSSSRRLPWHPSSRNMEQSRHRQHCGGNPEWGCHRQIHCTFGAIREGTGTWTNGDFEEESFRRDDLIPHQA